MHRDQQSKNTKILSCIATEGVTKGLRVSIDPIGRGKLILMNSRSKQLGCTIGSGRLCIESNQNR